MKKKGKFDYVLLETTGLADPGPIASMFWMDEQLCSDIYLDGNISQSLVFYITFRLKCLPYSLYLAPPLSNKFPSYKCNHNGYID